MFYTNDSELSESEIYGIMNFGSNCYLNSGLQIIASCQELIYELNKIPNSQIIISYIKEAISSLLKQEKIYNPKNFIDYFCSINSDFIIGSAGCSQNFIRTIIRNMNSDCLIQNFDIINSNSQYNPSGIEKSEYEKFILSNEIYPESRIQSIFSSIIKSYSEGKCKYCSEKILNFSFSYSLDLNIYLDEFCKTRSYYFSKVLYSNIGCANNLIMDCPKCKRQNNLKQISKFIKLPDILIFTLERYQGKTNKVEIIPDPIIYMSDYIDNNLNVDCLEYELFAINIRFGKNANFGHEICQVKRGGNWYEINDRYGYQINKTSHYDSSYGLFYRKKKILSNDSKNNIFCQINNQGYKEINSGLIIIASFEEFKKELDKYNKNDFCLINLIKEATNKILNNKDYNAKDLIKFKKSSKNSQSFIIDIINMINKEFIRYKEYINLHDDFYYSPSIKEYNQYKEIEKRLNSESKSLSIFSMIFKYHSKCIYCKHIDEYSFYYDIQKSIILKNTSKFSYNFIEILDENFKINYKACSYCNYENKFTIQEETKIVKLPKIFIFTIINSKEIEIKPDDIIDMGKYIDSSLKENKTKYKLFAVNILNKDNDNCQVKRKEKWYEICEKGTIEISSPDYNKYICGLFYKKLDV